MLNIEKVQNDTELTLKLEGRLDTLMAPKLEEDLRASIQELPDWYLI